MSFLFVRLFYRELFPDGLPEEFSFVASFRMNENSVKKDWVLWQIRDSSMNPQVGIRLNGLQKALQFIYVDINRQLQSVTFR